MRKFLAAAAILLVIVAAWMISAPVLSRIVRSRMISALEENYASTIEIKNLDVSVFPRVRITAQDLVFHLKDRPEAPPLFTIRKLTASASIPGLLVRHISEVRLEGLDIKIPPRDQKPHEKKTRESPPRFVIGEIIADGTTISTLPGESWKEPLVFDVGYLRLLGGGPQDAMTFHAVLTNAKPPGEIKSSGKFGPWAMEDPALTPVSGTYTFRNADLSVFKGIAGMLSSDGSYGGALGRIEVAGTTDVPDFRLSIAENPVRLTTKFQAVVDGTDGNTYLQPVEGKFGNTALTAKGSVEGQKGVPGKTVSLDVIVNAGRIEDILLLSVKGADPPMRGAIHFHSKLVIPPGHVDVAEKIRLDGAFTLDSAQFSKLDVQEKVNELSHRAKGNPKESKEDTVASNFQGQFQVDKGVITLHNISFAAPGIQVQLNGTYGLLTSEMNFKGTARLEAEVSQTTTGWKSLLLKAVDPIFKKKNAGAQIPIQIKGTPANPKFGLGV